LTVVVSMAILVLSNSRTGSQGGPVEPKIGVLMRRTLLLVVGLLLTLAVGTPAAAAPAEASKGSPAAYCRSVKQEFTNPVSGQTYAQYVIRVKFTFGGQTVVEEFGLASLQACVSTVASAMTADGTVPGNALTKPAYLAQCDLLVQFGVVAYPYAFYGLYPAENRADCARILKGVHTGQLEVPQGPPVG
jgi:hypothetical protein